MRQPAALLLRRRLPRLATVATWLAGILSVALLAYVVFGVVHQIVAAPPALRLILVRDIPLPSGLGKASVPGGDPLAPGVTVPFDRFDFQAYDPQTHKLFVAHTGPNPDKLALARIPFDPANDGHVIVFDTLTQQVIGRVNIPHVAGIAIAGDLHKVYVSDAIDNVVDAIDENTLRYTAIQFDDNESPDAISYDPVDQRIFVSDPGVPANPDQTARIDRKNQNVVVIDARKDTVVAKINLGGLPKLPAEDVPVATGTDIPAFGYDVGHNRYDATRHRVFVTTQILPDADSPNPSILPPPGTGELMAIDPLAAKVVQRVVLPATCSTPHGMALDTQQEVAFIACIDVDAATGRAPNLVRVDLRTMTVIPADLRATLLAPVPDIVVIDYTNHVVFVGCRGGISLFDERSGAFRKLGEYHLGKNTHTIALDEKTQYLYLALDVGGRPVLRIVRYNPNGS